MKNLIFILLIFLVSGCNENDPGLDDYDYLVFGSFYGFCQGEACIEIFKVTGSDVYEDTKDIYPGREELYSGNFKKLDRSFYAAAKGLENYIPAELINSKEKVIGQPDAGDWGGLYFEFSANGTREFWIIDANKNNLPAYLIPFAEQIEARIAALQPPQ